MSALPPIQIKHSPVRTADVFQRNHPGAQADLYKRGWWPAVPASNGAAYDWSGIEIWGSRLFVTGAFTTLGGLARVNFGAVDIETGAVDTAWIHSFTAGISVSSVYTVLATDDWLYVAGDFQAVDGTTTIASYAINGLVRFDYSGALDTTWNPRCSGGANPPLPVCLAWDSTSDSILIAGVLLTSICGAARTRAGAVSVASPAAVTAWNPAPDGAVRRMICDVTLGKVYIAGEFSNIFGVAGVGLVRGTLTGAGALDATWTPAPNGSVYAVEIGPDGLVYAGGRFTNIGGSARNYAAAIDATTGLATTWNPNMSGRVNCFGFDGNIVFIGGAFALIGGVSRHNLAAVLAGSAATLQAWNPDPGATGYVWSLKVLGRTVFCGGAMTGGFVRYPYPIFTDTNTIHVAKTGSDSAAGTAAAPVLTITYAETLLTGALTYILVTDDGVYDETVTITYSANEAGGLYAADGCNPTITRLRGAVAGTYGARRTGRTQFYAGSHYCYVSKAGNDGTGTRDHITLPFLTIQAAITAASAGDCVQILDDGSYTEDLDAGANAITIEAADGKVPVLITASGAGGTHLHANAGVGVNLYGLTFRDPVQTTGYSVALTGSSDIYDCTFAHNAYQLSVTGSKTYNVVNCEFFRAYLYAIYSGNNANENTILTCSNMVMISCGEAGTGYASLFVKKSGGSSNLSVVRSTFLNGRSDWEIDISSSMGGGITDCVFRNSTTVPTLTSGVLFNLAGGYDALARNCLFDSLGGHGIRGDGLGEAEHCAAISCGRHGGTFLGFNLSDFTNLSSATDCVSLDATYAGFYTAGVGTVGRCAVINAGNTGYIAVGLTGCLEAGSATYSAYGCTMTYSCLGTVSSGSTFGVGSYNANPLFVSAVPSDALVGLSAQSLGISSASDGYNMGPRWPLLTISAANHPFTIDGITFDGDPYFNDGVLVPSGVSGLVTVSQCSFTRLMGFAMWLDSGACASNCYANVNGLGAVMVSGDGSISRSVLDECGSAGVFVGTVGPTVEHTTAFGCEYGVYEFATGGGGTQNANVLDESRSGYDYSGSGAQAYSDVPNLSADASVTNGVRSDPLFLDKRTPDLRLQSTEAGYPYDSPAKGLALDGSDAGAYDIFYGPVSTTWTLLDFGTATWINPFHTTITLTPIKPTAGDTFGGVTFDDAAAYKDTHLLDWDANAAMPDAQATGLFALYRSASGECQVSFDDGVTFTACRVLHGTQASRTQLAGLYYSVTDVPMPVLHIALRESA